MRQVTNYYNETCAFTIESVEFASEAGFDCREEESENNSDDLARESGRPRPEMRFVFLQVTAGQIQSNVFVLFQSG